jgi:predicted amidohydrolase
MSLSKHPEGLPEMDLAAVPLRLVPGAWLRVSTHSHWHTALYSSLNNRVWPLARRECRHNGQPIVDSQFAVLDSWTQKGVINRAVT